MGKAKFCKVNKLAVGQFYYWCSKLRPDLNSKSYKNRSINSNGREENLFLLLNPSAKAGTFKIKLNNGIELEFFPKIDGEKK